ncbi:MAG: hypothetical protein WCA77_06145 [Thermoplasmata archaeon]
MARFAYRLEVVVVKSRAAARELHDVVYLKVTDPESLVAPLAGESIPTHHRDAGRIPEESPTETPRAKT